MQTALFEKARFRIAGDTGLLVEYGDAIDPEVNHKVRSMALVQQQHLHRDVREIIPTYRALLIVSDPLKTTPATLKHRLILLDERLAEASAPPPKTSM